MKAFIALVRREWWEHQAGFLWTPLAILTLLLVVALSTLLVSGEASITYSVERQTDGQRVQELHQWDQGLLGLLDVAGWTPTQVARRMERFRHTLTQPFVLAHFLVAVFVLLGALHDERRDRSVLFFKSLPVSDTATVASKLLLAVWVAPAISIAAAVLAEVLLLLMVTLIGPFHGMEGAGKLWLHSGLIGAVAGLAVGYLLQGLWALPVYAWLLAVSAAAPRVPFVWATLIPLLLVVLEGAVFHTVALKDAILGHLSFRALPRPASLAGAGDEPAVGLTQQLDLLRDGELWLGVLAAAVFFAAAVYFRRRNNDL